MKNLVFNIFERGTASNAGRQRRKENNTAQSQMTALAQQVSSGPCCLKRALWEPGLDLTSLTRQVPGPRVSVSPHAQQGCECLWLKVLLRLLKGHQQVFLKGGIWARLLSSTQGSWPFRASCLPLDSNSTPAPSEMVPDTPPLCTQPPLHCRTPPAGTTGTMRLISPQINRTWAHCS